MYIAEQFSMSTSDALAQADARGVGDLVTHGERGIDITYLPFVLLPDDGGPRRLASHVARTNLQWQDEGPATWVVHGPDSYLSPELVPPRRNPSGCPPSRPGTTSVHLREPGGPPMTVEAAVASRPDRRHEPKWRLENRPVSAIERMLPALVGIELIIDEVIGKAKLSQCPPTTQASPARWQGQPSDRRIDAPAHLPYVRRASNASGKPQVTAAAKGSAPLRLTIARIAAFELLKPWLPPAERHGLGLTASSKSCGCTQTAGQRNVRTKIRNVVNGKTVDRTFPADTKIDRRRWIAPTSSASRGRKRFVVMDTTTYDQLTIPRPSARPRTTCWKAANHGGDPRRCPALHRTAHQRRTRDHHRARLGRPLHRHKPATLETGKQIRYRCSSPPAKVNSPANPQPRLQLMAHSPRSRWRRGHPPVPVRSRSSIDMATQHPPHQGPKGGPRHPLRGRPAAT